MSDRNCDQCGCRCGPFLFRAVRIFNGQRWCSKCWRKYGERRRAASLKRDGYRYAGFGDAYIR